MGANLRHEGLILLPVNEVVLCLVYGLKIEKRESKEGEQRKEKKVND